MGKCTVAVAHVLPLCAVLLVFPAIAASQPTPLTVQSVLTQDAGGNNKTAFAPGEPIRFVAQLNNSFGGSLLAANGTQVGIASSFYNDTKPADIPPGVSIWVWNATAPAQQSSYTVTVRAYDHFYGRWAEASASFNVTAGPAPAPPTYAAVAFSPSLKAVREGFGPTAADAQADAINNCLRYANDHLADYYRDCAPFGWVYNGFIALASSGRAPRELDWAWGNGWGHTPEQAAQEAVRLCQQYGGGGPGKAPCLQVGGSPFRSRVYDASQPSSGGPKTVNWTTAPLPRTDLSVQQINPAVIRLTWRNPWSSAHTEPLHIEINNGNESRFIEPSRTSYDWAVRLDEYMCFKVRAINNIGNDIGWSWWEPNVSPWYRCAGHLSY